jgi:hypothetical protein
MALAFRTRQRIEGISAQRHFLPGPHVLSTLYSLVVDLTGAPGEVVTIEAAVPVGTQGRSVLAVREATLDATGQGTVTFAAAA